MNIPLTYKPKFIKHYEYLYGITRIGLVYSFTRWKYRRGSITKDGYMLIKLSRKSIQTNYYIHRLVAQAFLPNPNNYLEVNHLNEIKTDNRVNNLEWCSREYNNSYGTRNERDRLLKLGCNNPMARQIRCIETNQVFKTMTEAARWCGSSVSGLVQACNKNVQHKHYHWEYVKEV